MKHHYQNLPQQYIQDAIQNPLLFQQNNPLISQSMSLLNSRMKKSFDSQLQQLTSKKLTNESIKRKLNLQKSKSNKSQQQQYQQNDHCQQVNYNDQIQNQRAIQEFQRQIQEKYKISVANKLYTFPKLKIKSIIDIISSSETSDDEQPNSQPTTSQQPSSQQVNSNQHNPFDPSHYNKKMKTQYFADQEISEKSNEDDLHIRNFKKVKNPNVKISDDTKKHNYKNKKNQSLKKDEHQNYSHLQKVKTTKKNPQVSIKQKTIKSKQTIKQPVQQQKQLTSQHHQKQQQWAIKQPKHNNQRLKTQMYNDSSRLSQSITDSKRKFYDEQFFTKK